MDISFVGAPSSVLPGDFTLAALPPAVDNARKYAWVTDLFDNQPDLVISNGTVWKPVRPLAARTTSGDVNMTLMAMANSPTQILNQTITANRTVTLSTQYAYSGARFRILRGGGGALVSIIIGALGSLGLAGNWMDVEFDGTGWKQTASGGLL